MNRSLYTTLFKDYHGLLRERHYQLNFTTRKLTMAPLAAAIRSMGDLGAQLTASWNQLYIGFWLGRKTGEPGEKPSKQRREPTQTQPTYGVGSGNRTRATLVVGERSHHYTIPASPCFPLLPCFCPVPRDPARLILI